MGGYSKKRVFYNRVLVIRKCSPTVQWAVLGLRSFSSFFNTNGYLVSKG